MYRLLQLLFERSGHVSMEIVEVRGQSPIPKSVRAYVEDVVAGGWDSCEVSLFKPAIFAPDRFAGGSSLESLATYTVAMGWEKP